MKILQIINNKEKYMDLLLIADEQENMIKKYLDRGDLFALYDDTLKTVAVVTKENNDTYEIKNIATYEKYRGKGYGGFMIKYIIQHYKNQCKFLIVGTGENEKILSFYKNLGFTYSHTIKNFFTDNYDHVMIEDGVQLRDMVYLKMEINL